MKLNWTSIAVYVLLIFSSAALVFSVQPLVGRILLPKLGGTTVVWNTCLVFFQAALLAGYLYADLLSRKLSLQRQILVHLGMLGLAGLTLPISFSDVSMPPDSLPAIWLLGQLTLGVGFPFLVISASAPLFQSWFSRTGLPSADNPYYLYAASNLGSILSLIAYPFLIEPSLGVVDQSTVWAFGYATVGLIIVVAAALTWKLSERTGLRGPFSQAGSAPASFKQKLTWAYLAMIPSALLVAVSGQITADVAPVPFLWMLPLVVFLLTFVIAFARRQLLPPVWLAAVGIPAGLLLAYALVVRQLAVHRSIEFNIFVFFVLVLLFHITLASRRPAADQLTGYYLAMSLGGVVGGAFTALVAPLVFDAMWEYPILLVVAAASSPLFLTKDSWSIATRAVFTLSMGYVCFHMVTSASGAPIWFHAATVIVVALGVFSALQRPAVFGLFAAVLIFANLAVSHAERDLLFMGRSYFSAHAVQRSPDQQFTVLTNGSTVHGRQSTDKEGQRYPLEYYARDTGIGKVFAEMDKRAMPQRIGIIGLGIGSLAAYIHFKRTADFFEIDPLVDEIARNPKLFTYVPACRERCKTILGDGRIEIGKQENGAYDLVVLDAFNSDAVPVHLLTSQAIDLYFEKIKPGGLLAIHLTNGYVRLPEVAAKIADEGGYSYVLLGDSIVWMVMARDPETLGRLPAQEFAWRVLDNDVSLWTDDFADILGSLRESWLF